MPELPEVEIIRLFLAQNIVKLKIESVEILNSKSFIGDKNQITGREITDVGRRGKILQLNLGGQSLLIHLKMSGQLVWINNIGNDGKFIGGHPTRDMFGDLPNKSTRVIFNLSGGSNLLFNDQRKFGWIRVASKNEVEADKFLNLLGPEPLENSLSVEVFKENLLKRKNTPIKVALLDQQILAGVGNIYASEACFIARIDPRKKVADLSGEQFKKLLEAVKETLNDGIKYGGSSKTHFANPEGKKGLFLDYAYVYGRENLPCKKCGKPIKKIKLGGRGTYFCAGCQVE